MQQFAESLTSPLNHCGYLTRVCVLYTVGLGGRKKRAKNGSHNCTLQALVISTAGGVPLLARMLDDTSLDQENDALIS